MKITHLLANSTVTMGRGGTSTGELHTRLISPILGREQIHCNN